MPARRPASLSRVGWVAVGRAVVRDTVANDTLNMAAALAYYWFLAFFPGLLALAALASFYSTSVLEGLIGGAASFMPALLVATIQTQVTALGSSHDVGIFTVGFATALWSSSTAASALIDEVNRAYALPPRASWWRQRVLAIGLSVLLLVFVGGSWAVIVIGPELAGRVAAWFGVAPIVPLAWAILRWPVVAGFTATAFAFLYYVVPNEPKRPVRFVPGAIVATLFWFGASLGFRVYMHEVGNYNRTYGTIAGAIVGLLWMYLIALALLVGAAVNSEIDIIRAAAAPPTRESSEGAPRPTG